MVKILVIEEDETTREVIKLTLESLYECHVQETDRIEKATEWVKKSSDWFMILCPFKVQQLMWDDLHKVAKSRMPQIVFFVTSMQKMDSLPVPHLQKPIHPTELENAIKGQPLRGGLLKRRVLKPITPLKQDETAEGEDFHPVRTKTLLKLGNLPCDFFIKLSERKFVKIFQALDYFGEEDFQRYAAKKMEALFLRSQDAMTFVQAYLKEVEALRELTDLVRSPRDVLALAEKVQDETIKADLLELAKIIKGFDENVVDLKKIFDVSEKAHTHAHKAMLRFGFTEEVEVVVRTSVSVAVNALKNDPKLVSLMRQFAIQPDSYISSHSTLLAFIAPAISSLMEWRSEITHHKLSLAAFLHDVTMDNQDLARCESMVQVLNLGIPFSPEEILSYQNHTNDAAEHLQEIKMIPPDVGIIIQQHHERPDGTGFPRGLRANRISPLSAVFIIAHDLVNWMQANNKPGNEEQGLNTYLVGAEKVFVGGHFSKIISALAKAVAEGKLK